MSCEGEKCCNWHVQVVVLSWVPTAVGTKPPLVEVPATGDDVLEVDAGADEDEAGMDDVGEVGPADADIILVLSRTVYDHFL